VKTGALTEAHELLLKDVDEVRRMARLVGERLEALEVQLAPRQAELARLNEAQERMMRETLAGASREWAETAAQYRKLVDELSRLIAWQQARVEKALTPWPTWIAAAVGGMLVALMTMWLAGSGGERLRQWIGIDPAPASVAPASEQPLAKPKPPAKGSAR
jgi:hypothetical protein